MRPLILGTRGSALALAQARLVETALRAAWPEIALETRVVKTRGDEGVVQTAIADRRAGRKGMFTLEIERELAAEQIDIAVHSAKDLPSALPAGLGIAAVLARAAAEDVLVTRAPGGIAALSAGARIGTASVRRKFQWEFRHPNFRVVELRGNVPTRLRKLRESGDYDAAVLARAGLERLGFSPASGSIELEGERLFATVLGDEWLPAGGQGIIALEARWDDEQTRDFLARIDHAETHLCLRAERDFLRLLDGDCDSPVGVQASVVGDSLRLRAEIFEPGKREPRAGAREGKKDGPEQLASDLWRQMHGG